MFKVFSFNSRSVVLSQTLHLILIITNYQDCQPCMSKLQVYYLVIKCNSNNQCNIRWIKVEGASKCLPKKKLCRRLVGVGSITQLYFYYRCTFQCCSRVVHFNVVHSMRLSIAISETQERYNYSNTTLGR